MVQIIQDYKNWFLNFYQRHLVLVSILVFCAGFLFDIFTIRRIDDLLNLIQHGIKLILLGTFLLIEIKIATGNLTLSGRGKRFWQYHDLFVHFLFGSLLSAYTIFFYTSASAITSFLFISLLVALMLANEVGKIRQLGLPVRVILYCICLMSYFSFFYPILFGKIGALPFWLGIMSSALVLIVIWKVNFRGENQDLTVRQHVLYPALFVHIFFVVAYYTSFIPPVPVAVKKIGAYYSVEKKDNFYKGLYLHHDWKFWSRAPEEFHARPGDKVTILMAIFSPARFQDQIFLKWFRWDSMNGWVLEDTIPMTILGGRIDGFRGFGTKQFYAFGEWKVVVETSDGREVGRLKLLITKDNTTGDRKFKKDLY